ncbi:NADH:ubiquinone oxidoreductase subunit M [Pseudomonas aeruginosa]|nr:NADH:ubiquinone oxidoreductase subunit M [Pseudomonas aeruginosa]
MILPWLILIPFIGGFLCWIAEHSSKTLPRWIALLSMTLVLILSLWIWATGDFQLAPAPGGEPEWTLQFKVLWIERLGISIHLAMDGLSLLMVALTGLLGVLSVLCSWNEIQRRIGFFHLNLLWILGGVIGVFLAIDLFLFFFFWEMMLVPMYFLIALWGHSSDDGKKTRIYAATKFFIFTQASGLVMLVAILGLVFVNFNATGVITFDYATLLKTQLSPHVEWLLMLGFFIAFAVKMPVVPVHSWLPDAHAQAPTAGSVDLAGILLKTAAYGLIRFALPLFPNASAEFAPIAMWLGIIGIFYGALLSFAQDRHQAPGCLLQRFAHGLRDDRHLLRQPGRAAGAWWCRWSPTASPPRRCSSSAASSTSACIPATCARWAACGRACPTCRRSACSSPRRRWACPAPATSSGSS